jgi:hypothetical protein
MPGDDLRNRVRERLSEQRRLVQSLLALREQLPGSLFARYAECRKEGCVCRTGRKHGPYFVFSQRSGGRGSFSYLGAGQVTSARRLVARSRAFRDGLRRLQAVNIELVALLRRYQKAMARRGERRLGLSSSRQP